MCAPERGPSPRASSNPLLPPSLFPPSPGWQLADVFPGGAPGVAYCARDVWEHAPVPGGPWTASFAAPLRPHAAGMFMLEPC